MTQRKNSARRQIVLAVIALWLFIALLFPNTVFPNSIFRIFHSQDRHLRAVREHLLRIQPEWDELRVSHPELSRVQLSEYTAGDGMIAAIGTVPSEQAVLTISNFLQNTKPPRPIYLNILSLDEKLTSELPKESGK